MLRDGLIVRTEEVVERVETKVSATQVQIENLQNLQQASLEVQQAREEAKKAMLMVLEEASRTAECEMGEIFIAKWKAMLIRNRDEAKGQINQKIEKAGRNAAKVKYFHDPPGSLEDTWR